MNSAARSGNQFVSVVARSYRPEWTLSVGEN